MEPVLAIPDIDREMRVEADTSDYATVIGIKRFDHRTKVKVRLERRNLQATS